MSAPEEPSEHFAAITVAGLPTLDVRPLIVDELGDALVLRCPVDHPQAAALDELLSVRDYTRRITVRWWVGVQERCFVGTRQPVSQGPVQWLLRRVG